MPPPQTKAPHPTTKLPSFVYNLASRGLNPDRRAHPRATNMVSRHCSSPTDDAAWPPDFKPDSIAYKLYLHRLPHLKFILVEKPEATSFCMACDETAPFELHVCKNCDLMLCGLCQYMITDSLVRGDLKRLIQHVARWKLGYSQAFIDREKAETTEDWKNYETKMEQEEEGRNIQSDIDRLFDKMLNSFTAGGDRVR